MLGWEQGLPVALDGAPLAGPDAGRAAWASCAEAYGIGRGIHVGETALGIKGRIGFEAGAALLLIGAHRELEKLVLTKWQTFWKDQLGRFYGDRLHEGQYFDPVAPRHRGADHQLAGAGHRRDPGAARARAGSRWSGTRSPHSMMDTLRRHVRRGEPALDRRRGARLRAGLGGAVAAGGAGGGGADERT